MNYETFKYLLLYSGPALSHGVMVRASYSELYCINYTGEYVYILYIFIKKWNNKNTTIVLHEMLDKTNKT